jgi:hypothetical protein
MGTKFEDFKLAKSELGKTLMKIDVLMKSIEDESYDANTLSSDVKEVINMWSSIIINLRKSLS